MTGHGDCEHNLPFMNPTLREIAREFDLEYAVYHIYKYMCSDV